MDIDALIRQMSHEEKAALVSGTDFMYTNPIPAYHIPSLCMADGPHGLRKQTGSADNGISESEPATAFPTAALSACGWNPDNLRKMGKAIAEECRHYGVHTLLGPGVNLKRNPLCGRNFEYFSEDPYLSGVMGAAETEGLQSEGVGACIKHFALNNSENFRFMGNSAASENTIRNLYLKPFEYIVKHAKPAALMCAYNQINGTYCSENRWLLHDVLRKEWGFEGVVMTDWGAMHDRVKSLHAGLDLEMPGDTAICRKWILDGLKDGSLAEEDLDQACRNILNWVDHYVRTDEAVPVDWQAHHELAAEIAADCAVLMKNDGILPLKPDMKIHVKGPFFEKMRYQGSGSSMIHATKITSVKDAFDSAGIDYSYSLEECDVIVIFAGLTDEYESEGKDRDHMRLPADQLELIERMCASGKKTAVVLFGGSPVELPFDDQVSAVLNMYLPGQNGGTAVKQLLYGDVNPSGKLAETWPLRYEDVPSAKTFGKGINEIYEEKTEIGYRYYNAHHIPVRYPFGHGLSYTAFKETEWVRNGNTCTKTITNTGERYGAQVAQLYIDNELCGFEKVYLKPGESKEVRIELHEKKKNQYDDTLHIPAQRKSFPITLESRFSDLKQTFMGRILFHAVLSVAYKQKKTALKMEDCAQKDNMLKGALFLERILESNSLISMSMSAGKSFPYNFAQGFMELANGHLIKGGMAFLKQIRVPALPKEKKQS